MDLAALTGGARAALGDDLLGLYLVGARALGADEQRGLAFVAVTAERLTPGPLAALEGLHTRLPDVAGTYAPAADLRSPMTVGRAWPCVDHGSRELVVSGHANTLAARWVLRERGVPVLGPPASAYVAAVDAGALRAEMIGVARTRAEDLEEHPERLADRSYRSDLVLTLCGALFTAYTSEVTDDAAAATWALGVVGAEHRAAVQRAVHATTDPLPVAATRAFVWEVHRLVGAEVLRQRE